MKERKYKEEYKLITELDEKGKLHQTPIYMGDYYAYAQGMTLAARVKAALPGLIGFIACYAVYMALSSPSSYCIYVLPLACCAVIPLMYACIGAANMLRFTGRMTRVQKETGVARLMRSLIGCGVLTALALLGDVIYMVRHGVEGEALAALMLALSSACAWYGFARVRRIHNGMECMPGKASQEAAQKAGERA